MAVLTVEKVLEATEGRLISGDTGWFSGVSIDTRTISEGDIFFAIHGERFDGHDFLEEALMKCGGAVVDSEPFDLPVKKVVIHVEDTLKALQDLARSLRGDRDIPVIAITGSNGKTTTKEMIYAVLSKKLKVLKTEGNLNNHIGLPLTLTRLSEDDEAAVLELGMNASGEIRRLTEISNPSHAVITNIGSAHLGRLGSYEAIRNAKLEILYGPSVAVLNADDNFLMSGIKGFEGDIITFAIKNDAHVMAKDISQTENGSLFTLAIRGHEDIEIRLSAFGLFNVYNALAAAAVSSSLGMSSVDIKEALEGFRPFPMRFEVIKAGDITVINDSYNANPSSIKEALKEMIAMRHEGRLVVLLGDMFELDEFAEEAHRALGKMISEMDIDVFVAIGELMSFAAEECISARGDDPKPVVHQFGSTEEAVENIMNILDPGDHVLVKGSRGMKLENVIGGITDAV
jgi:UDP-N-acetylmuramoyl-tripeptide--D-alanyl-D-alanine ligase